MKSLNIKIVLSIILFLIVAGSIGGYLIVKKGDSSNLSSGTEQTDTGLNSSNTSSQDSLVHNNTTTTEEMKEESTTKKQNTENGTGNVNGSEYAYSYAGIVPVLAKIDEEKWNLLLVNRNYILPEDYTVKLAVAAPDSKYDTELDARAAPYYSKMYNAAREDGITLVPLSGHRRISTQKKNFENKISLYQGKGYSRAQATQLAAEIILPPGTSEHNAGIAMDICSLDVSFENSKEFKWLKENAADYGFILRYAKNKQDITKITYEPWHWRYVGVEAARAMASGGQCLEEYLSN